MEIICKRNEIRDPLQTDTEGRKGSWSGSTLGRWERGPRLTVGRSQARFSGWLGHCSTGTPGLSLSLGLQVQLWNTVRTQRDSSDPVPSARSALSKRALCTDARQLLPERLCDSPKGTQQVSLGAGLECLKSPGKIRHSQGGVGGGRPFCAKLGTMTSVSQRRLPPPVSLGARGPSALFGF